MQILLHQSLVGVHQQNHYVGFVDGFQGFDNGELFHRLPNILAPTHAGRVDQCVRLLVAGIVDVDTVPGGSRLVVDHDPLFTQQAIHQCRFAYIGSTDNSNPNAGIALRCIRDKRWGQVIQDPTD